MYSRARLDALGDGIFGVAMTLLVLDIRLPEDFSAANSAELMSGLAKLTPRFIPYVLSFFVLGLRWMYEAEERRHGKEDHLYSRTYVRGWLLLLFLVTCTPFTTIVLGRFVDVPAAIWLYVGNMAALSVVSFFLSGNAEDIGQDKWRERTLGLVMFLACCAAAVALSFVWPEWAMWALFLNALTPLFRRTQPSKAVAA